MLSCRVHRSGQAVNVLFAVKGSHLRTNLALLAAILTMASGCSVEGGNAVAANGSVPSSAVQKPRTLAALPLSPDTTRDAVNSAWGEGLPFGPDQAMSLYALGTGETLWLSFGDTPLQKLVRAVLLKSGPSSKPQILIDTLTTTKSRRCDQLAFSGTVTEAQVNAAWGPPDNVAGSGIDNWMYKLANGETAVLNFLDGKVAAVRGCTR